MDFFDKEKINQSLLDFYIKKYGECESDQWFEQPAVNVVVFKRDNKIITLKCDIRTKEVTEYIEEV